jgi:pimeloyl-ACP methyl ester carboxylesterase
VSRAAFVADAAAWLERLADEPAAVAGQSLGGHTAMLLASDRPDLVSALVVAEASPAADPGAPERVRAWLERWPVPFASRAAALRYFGGRSLWARAWAAGLDPGADGLRPRFDVDVMVAALAEVAARSWWGEWGRIACPALIVRAAGEAGAADAVRMRDALPRSELVEIAGAGHDVHLDRPRAWRAALERFLAATAA